MLQTYSATDAFGNVTSESYGNGVATTRAYDPETGQLTAIETDKGSTVIQDHDYAWRSNGTLESRIANPNSGITTTRKENFGYDAHNRLTLAETFINGSNTRDLTYSYNSLGNIAGKTSSKVGDTDVTGYSYHNTKKHAVTSATINDGSGAVSHTLTYDGNGAITKYDRSGTSLDRHIQYNAVNQPTKIVVGASLTDPNASAVDEFAYGPDGRRYTRKTTWVENGVTRSEDVSYIGDVEYTSYVHGSSPVVSVFKTRVGDNIIHVYSFAINPLYNPSLPYPYNQPFFVNSATEYAHRDHLGSIDSVTNQNGNLLQQLAYEPFGARKDSDWAGNIDSAELSSLLNSLPVVRGFTGHEHLDKTGFIHMNGRVYDPVLGRFLSPDPFVQAPGNSQSWNRYTYTFNNPLNATDPSGYLAANGYKVRWAWECASLGIDPRTHICMNGGHSYEQQKKWEEENGPSIFTQDGGLTDRGISEIMKFGAERDAARIAALTQLAQDHLNSDPNYGADPGVVALHNQGARFFFGQPGTYGDAQERQLPQVIQPAGHIFSDPIEAALDGARAIELDMRSRGEDELGVLVNRTNPIIDFFLGRDPSFYRTAPVRIGGRDGASMRFSDSTVLFIHDHLYSIGPSDLDVRAARSRNIDGLIIHLPTRTVTQFDGQGNSTIIVPGSQR